VKSSATDTGLASGSTHTYQIRIKDPFGNVLGLIYNPIFKVADVR